MSQKTEKTSGNIDQSIAFLNYAFEKATKMLGYKNQKGTKLYDYQTEFMWIMHEIQNGPIFSVPHFIQEANNLIRNIEETKKSK